MKITPFRAIGLCALTTTLGASHDAAAAGAYGIDGNGNLRFISNLTTMSSTILGSTPFNYAATDFGNVGLAISPTGQLYAGDQMGNIFTVSMTGVSTLIGNTGVPGPITGLDWDPQANSLLVVTGSPTYQIYRASPVNGLQIGPAVSVNVSGGRTESIAWLDPTRALLTYKDPGNTISLVHLVSLATGALVGTPASTTILTEWTGVDVDPASGTIYMIGWLDDSWTVTNAAGTLTATHLATNTHADWTAFTMAPIPEPSSLSLIASGLAFVTLRRRRGARFQELVGR